MEPIGSRKRKSDEATMSHEELYADAMTTQRIPTKDAATPQAHESPLKRQRVGITLAQKQALVDNLQLEITERARKLRANYNIHAQSLRTRIEIRVNRIPLSLRKLTMGELLDKYSAEQQQQKPSATTSTTRGPPVPAKDHAPSRPPTRGAAPSSSRQPKRLSHEISGGDKENEVLTPQKKMRAHPAAADIARNPGHVLSPTTSNSRVPPRSAAATPARSGIARPLVTPGRAAAASSILNRMVGDGTAARSTTRPTTTTSTSTSTARKTTTSALSASTNTNSSSQSSSSAAAAAAAAARRKRGATVTATSTSTHHHTQPVRPATRTGTTTAAATRRASGASETSEGSTGTVVVKRPMTAPPGAQPRSAGAVSQSQPGTGKRTGGGVMGTIRKGVGAAAGAGAGTGTGRKTIGAGGGSGKGTGRVLRKRA